MNDHVHKSLQFDATFAPALRMYMENFESWKKNCEQLFTQAGGSNALSAAGFNTSAGGRPAADCQQLGTDAYRHFVEQQIELCRFFAKRWDLYRELPEKLANCKNPADFGQLQFDFLERMSSEYLEASAKLAQPLTEMMTNWASANSGR